MVNLGFLGDYFYAESLRSNARSRSPHLDRSEVVAEVLNFDCIAWSKSACKIVNSIQETIAVQQRDHVETYLPANTFFT